MFEHRLEPHDRNQLELKLAYPVDLSRRRQAYRVELYLYASRTLGIDASTYQASSFFSDTVSFMRMQSPRVELEALADDGRSEALFGRTWTVLHRVSSGDQSKKAIRRAEERLRLLGCVYRAAIRDEGYALIGRLEEVQALGDAAGPAIQEVAAEMDAFSMALAGALDHLRTFSPACLVASVPERVQNIWKVVDEYTTVLAEEVVTGMVEICDAIGDPALSEVREQLADLAISAFEHRRTRGYPSWNHSHPEPDGRSVNERLPYRRRVLKRIIASALYLDLTPQRPGRLILDIIGMVAAAAAMLFAIVVAVIAQNTWGPFSGAFIAVMVASYIIKDRIKEWGKRYMGARAQRYFPDRRVLIRDPRGGRTIGTINESFQVIDPKKVDRDVTKLRHMDHPTKVAEAGRQEVVVRYIKDVRLDGHALRDEGLDGVDGLTDIIRLNIHRLRRRMDDPDEPYHYVHTRTRKVVETTFQRVYHLNLVLRLVTGRGANERVESERVRVVVDQSGIRRVEDVTGRGAVLGMDPVTGRVLPT